MKSESPSGKLLWAFLSEKSAAVRLFRLKSKAGIHKCHLSSGDVSAQIRSD